MHAQDPLVFDPASAAGKPENIRHRENPCPFCNVEGLTDVIRRDGDMIWLVNKFRTLRNTMQTVLIESAEHTGDTVTYAPAEWRRIMRFAVECFEEMRTSGKYESVLMFKNYGPLSGGTLLHPHMQIVGLDDKDGYSEVSPENLEGAVAFAGAGVEVNVATRPVMGFTEFNVAMSDSLEAVDTFADAVRETVRYALLSYHGGTCDSYNLFFFHMGGKFVCRVILRWVASPYFIGYRISQVNCPEDVERVRAELERALSGRLGDGA